MPKPLPSRRELLSDMGLRRDNLSKRGTPWMTVDGWKVRVVPVTEVANLNEHRLVARCPLCFLEIPAGRSRIHLERAHKWKK